MVSLVESWFLLRLACLKLILFPQQGSGRFQFHIKALSMSASGYAPQSTHTYICVAFSPTSLITFLIWNWNKLRIFAFSPDQQV